MKFITQLREPGTDMWYSEWLVFEHATKNQGEVNDDVEGKLPDASQAIGDEDGDYCWQPEDHERYLVEVRKILEPLGYTNIAVAEYVFSAT